METENKKEIIEESPEENNIQVEDHPDKFSDQEDDDDFYKIQIENFKNKTAKDFHKNIIIIDEKGREIHSARFSSVHPRNFKKKEKKQSSKKDQPQETPARPVQERLILNNSSGQPENSTTVNDNASGALQKNYQQSQNEEKENEDEKKEEKESSESENEENEESENEENKKINQPPPREPNEDILSYYEKLRNHFDQTKVPYEDPDFPCNTNIFCDEYENPNGDYEIDFERPDLTEENIEFFAVEPHTNNEYNIEHEFKLRRGLLNDKFFIGAMIMLFRQHEEFFTDLVVDFEHVNENLMAGFCGFQFFINGEWQTVTVDTKLPCHQKGEYSLTQSKNKKGPFWVSLFEKAYAKLFGTYRVLNNTLLKDFLVDFTGGWSKMIKVPKPSVIEEKTKKFFFDEITRCMSQNYLIGCMKLDDSKIIEELNESLSEKDDAEPTRPRRDDHQCRHGQRWPHRVEQRLLCRPHRYDLTTERQVTVT